MLGLPYNFLVILEVIMNTKLSSSLEDYLEIIYNNKDNEKKIRAVDIANTLNISRASVTEALKKLSNKGYINYGRYDTISLTQQGVETARNITSKHTILQRFFEENLGLTTKEASENACKIEHVITDNAFLKISEIVIGSK